MKLLQLLINIYTFIIIEYDYTVFITILIYVKTDCFIFYKAAEKKLKKKRNAKEISW